jgi:hypothetical protein
LHISGTTELSQSPDELVLLIVCNIHLYFVIR